MVADLQGGGAGATAAKSAQAGPIWPIAAGGGELREPPGGEPPLCANRRTTRQTPPQLIAPPAAGGQTRTSYAYTLPLLEQLLTFHENKWRGNANRRSRQQHESTTRTTGRLRARSTASPVGLARSLACATAGGRRRLALPLVARRGVATVADGAARSVRAQVGAAEVGQENGL